MSAAAFAQDLEAARRGAIVESRWPYPWIAIPPGGVPFCAAGSEEAPAWGSANQILVCEKKVPIGWEGVLTDVMHCYTDLASTFVEGSGDIVWDYDLNRPLGNPLLSGNYLQDYFHVRTRRGDLSLPWPVRGGIRLKQGDELRQKVYTVGIVTTGAPAFVHGALLGWTWPMASTKG